MKYFMVCLIFTFLFTANIAQARRGIADSGGGTVISCEDNSYSLLDYWEANQRGLIIKFEEGIEFDYKVEILLDRLAKFNPIRARKYRKYWDNFFREAMFVDTENLGIVTDVGPVPVPLGCELIQAAGQLVDLLPGDPRYYISQPVWNKLSETDKAGLVIHEIIYRDYLEEKLNVPTTRKIRYFNLLLGSNSLELFNTDKQKYDISFKLGLSSFQTTKNFPIKILECDYYCEALKVTFNEKGTIQSGFVFDSVFSLLLPAETKLMVSSQWKDEKISFNGEGLPTSEQKYLIEPNQEIKIKIGKQEWVNRASDYNTELVILGNNLSVSNHKMGIDSVLSELGKVLCEAKTSIHLKLTNTNIKIKTCN